MFRRLRHTLFYAAPSLCLVLGALPATATPSGQYVTRATPQSEPGLYVVEFVVYQESPEPPHVARTWRRTYRLYCPTETVRNITNGAWGEAVPAQGNFTEGTGVLPNVVRLVCGVPNRWRSR